MKDLRFEIDPRPDESQRACTAIAQAVLPPSRGNALMIGLYAAVGLAAYLLTPSTRPITFLIGLAAVTATAYALQAESRRRLRALRTEDPHALETHYLEFTADGIHTWCAHIDARYPWRDFAKVSENSEFYLFSRPSGTGAAVPKRLLNDDSDAALRTCIRERAPDRGTALARELV